MKPTYNIIDVVKDAVKGTTEYCSEEVKAQRLAICNACPARNAAMNTCGDCYCWLPGKTRYAKSTCPRSKW